MKIKVCGMRDAMNINALLDEKPNYVGYIFYEKSKRFVVENPKITFPENVKKVGVFVNATEMEIEQKVNEYNLDFVQLHGNETTELCFNLMKKNISIIKAFSVDSTFDFQTTIPYTPYCSFFIFDTKGLEYGGNGTKFNWDLLQNYTGIRPFLLSGGIEPNDVSNLKDFQHDKFMGIDINSGFETSAAYKNITKIRQFKTQLKNEI
ncbi:phosphoribosylanthranilate isomerase [Aureivirga marina]|uniref:phosphoribosylanthranilate isomerase n=1 Tax=Aureivirga marina TaxID=1182451 RepID=UPI0018C9C11B|nr:phosphoribosylanthranilate isomerase [Aureivirga marina]